MALRTIAEVREAVKRNSIEHEAASRRAQVDLAEKKAIADSKSRDEIARTKAQYAEAEAKAKEKAAKERNAPAAGRNKPMIQPTQINTSRPEAAVSTPNINEAVGAEGALGGGAAQQALAQSGLSGAAAGATQGPQGPSEQFGGLDINSLISSLGGVPPEIATTTQRSAVRPTEFGPGMLPMGSFEETTTFEPNVLTPAQAGTLAIGLAEQLEVKRGKHFNRLAEIAIDPNISEGDLKALQSQYLGMTPTDRAELDERMAAKKAVRFNERTAKASDVAQVIRDYNEGEFDGVPGHTAEDILNLKLKAIEKGNSTTIDLGVGKATETEYRKQAKDNADSRERVTAVLGDLSRDNTGWGAQAAAKGIETREQISGVVGLVPLVGPYLGEKLRPSAEQEEWLDQYRAVWTKASRVITDELLRVAGTAQSARETANAGGYLLSPKDDYITARRKMEDGLLELNLGLGRFALYDKKKDPNIQPWEVSGADLALAIQASDEIYLGMLMQNNPGVPPQELTAWARKHTEDEYNLTSGGAKQILIHEGLLPKE